ncbi:MAG TPA: ATP-binding cassette domain-containing protein [Acidimicrobiales bacterium]|nr:ATP-binding cassette domain-containing protein [Acidimicrobiales bacterium]
MRTTPAIRTAGLAKSYGDVEVLRHVDLEVAPGSIFALLGANGAGKTTLVNILSTLVRADAGSAAVHGFDVVSQADDVRRSISLTGQFAAVDEVLTGRENLVLIARLRHLDRPGSPTTCSPRSRSPRPEAGGCPPTRAACVAVWTSP